MSNEKTETMKIITELMKSGNISLLDFMAFKMEQVMTCDGTDLCDIPSILHGLSRNIVGRLAPE